MVVKKGTVSKKTAAAAKIPAAGKAAEDPAAVEKTAETKVSAETANPVEEKKAPAKKPAAKKPAAPKKTAPKEIKTAICVQFAGKEYTEQSLAEAAKNAYAAMGNKVSDIKTLDIYVKPEENAAYYTVNGNGGADYKIEL